MIREALIIIHNSLIKTFIKMENIARRGQLKPNSGDSAQSAAQDLSTQIKTTCSVVPQLLTCASQSDDQAFNSAAMSAAGAVQGFFLLFDSI